MKYAQITPDNKRRYYLQKRLKHKACKILSAKKIIIITDDAIESLTPGQKRSIDELQNEFGYTIAK